MAGSYDTETESRYEYDSILYRQIVTKKKQKKKQNKTSQLLVMRLHATDIECQIMLRKSF